MSNQKLSKLTKDELVKYAQQLETENNGLLEKLQGFEDIIGKIRDFAVQLEEFVPQKLLGWFRFILMGFATMKVLIDTIQEFANTLEEWKNRNTLPSDQAEVKITEAISAAKRIPLKAGRTV